MELEDEWKSKITKFNILVETSCLDANANEEFLFDILQDLFSENLREFMKVELVLLIQQYEEELIDGVEKAEQVCGSLLNLYQSLASNLVLFRAQVLVTVTGICLDFNLSKEAEYFYQDFVSLLIDVVMRVSSGHPLLRKICSDCLFVIEDTHPGSLLKYITILLNSSRDEKLFPVYTHMLVVASVIFDSLTHCESDEDALVMEGTNFNLNKSVLFLVKGMNLLSPAGLILMLKRILTCPHQSKLFKSVLSMLLYCLQSWDICQVYVYIYVHKYFQVINQCIDHTQIIFHLVKLMNLNQLKPLHQSIIQYWIRDYILAADSPMVSSEACTTAVILELEPKIYTHLQYFPSKLAIIFQICSGNTLFNLSVDKQASILRILTAHSKFIHTYDNLSDLFSSLFLLYKHGASTIRENIIHTVQQLTVGSLKLVMYTIDFCDNIEGLDSNDISFCLLNSIVNNLICLDINDIFSDIKAFFLILERIAVVKELCPLNIIQSLKGVVRHFILRGSTWQEGNLLLSISRNLIINNDRNRIRYEIASLLWNISQSFPNQNIRDRALSYYLILGKMSSKSYKDIFVSSSFLKEKAKSEVDEVTPVVSQGPLLVRRSKNNYLLVDWKEAITEGCYLWCLNDEDDILLSYFSFISSDKCDKYVSHKFRMTMRNGGPAAIFAIKLDLSTSGSFESPKSVYCSHLKIDEAEGNKGQEIIIQFKPTSPQRARFDVSATYIDQENNCWFTNLKPFYLEFRHLLKPLPAVENADTRKELFQVLWDYIQENQISSSCALSVKKIESLHSTQVCLCLRYFVVTQTDRCVTAGIYLPPKNHVLLKFDFNKSDATAWIATDDITLLDEIDIFLESLAT